MADGEYITRIIHELKRSQARLLKQNSWIYPTQLQPDRVYLVLIIVKWVWCDIRTTFGPGLTRYKIISLHSYDVIASFSHSLRIYCTFAVPKWALNTCGLKWGYETF